MTEDDATLLIRARRDPEAFACFYRRHFERLLAYFGRRVTSPEVAADLVAETFARALQGLNSFRPQRGPAVAWLLAIAHNQLVDAHRRGQVQERARQRLGMGPIAMDDDDLLAIDRRLSEASEVDAILAGLTDTEREVVVAHIIDEQPFSAIAGSLRCSEAVVRKRLSRGLARLRSNMEGCA